MTVDITLRRGAALIVLFIYLELPSLIVWRRGALYDKLNYKSWALYNILNYDRYRE